MAAVTFGFFVGRRSRLWGALLLRLSGFGDDWGPRSRRLGGRRSWLPRLDDRAASLTTGAFPPVECGVPFFCRLLGKAVGCRRAILLEGGGRLPRSGCVVDCPVLAFPGVALAGISGGADAERFFEGGRRLVDHAEGILEFETRGEANASLPT